MLEQLCCMLECLHLRIVLLQVLLSADMLTDCLCYSYEVVSKHKDTKGQLMSLQQTLRQEIHAKIAAQTAEESAKRKVAQLSTHHQ